MKREAEVTRLKVTELESGLTWRAFLANVLAIVFFIPTSFYLFLVTGQGLGAVSVYSITLLFTELTRLSYTRLKKPEVFMVYYGALWGGASVIYLPLLYNSYFVRSPFAWAADIEGTPLALLVPSWLAPPPTSSAFILRSVIHPDFYVPIAVILVQQTLVLIANLSLGMLIARLSIQVEKYEFPFAQVEISLIEYMCDRPPERSRIFILAMLPGAIYSALAYFGPIFLNIQFVPLPFYDLTWLTQDILPGAALGMGTILSLYFGGFMVPFVAGVIAFVVSFVLRVVFNSLFITTFPDLFPEWRREYFKGMGLIAIQSRAAARVWFPINLGFTVAASIFMFYKARRGLKALLGTLLRGEERKADITGFPSNKRLIAIFLAASALSIVLFNYLVPGIPIWIPIFSSTIYSFLLGLAIAAMQGEVGYNIPAAQYANIWPSMVYLSSYQGYAGFAFSPVIVGAGAGTFSQRTKVALGLGAKPTDLPKMQIIAWAISWTVSLFILNYFWRLAPIPSAAYPYTLYGMPAFAQTRIMLCTRQMRFAPEYVLTPMGIVLAISFIGEMVSKIGIPFSHTGFFIGLLTPTSATIPMLVGSAISTFIMPRFFGGKKNWLRIRSTVVAGEFMGEGIVLIFLLAFSLLSKSAWMWPW